MNDQRCRIRPNGKVCVGRTEMVGRIISSAFNDRATLLFGGRQSGKTTLLCRIEQLLELTIANVREMGDVDAAVYIDLMTMDHEAGPADFFRHLTNKLANTCRDRIQGFELGVLPSDNSAMGSALDQFHDDILAIFKAAGEVELRVLFLLDESQRVLGKRFPRGFQDNLFALLYGAEFAASERVAMVFAGGNELYGFCEDETSPIGSRAAIEVIRNLVPNDIVELLRTLLPTMPSHNEVANSIWSYTGGHAGLTARFVERVSEDASVVDFNGISEELKMRHGELFKLWVLSLGEEAKCVHETLASKHRLTFKEIAGVLRDSGFDQYFAPTVCDVLEFTGIARVENRELQTINKLYWDFIGHFHIGGLGGESPDQSRALNYKSHPDDRIERAVWDLIERLELALRAFVLGIYESNWRGRALDQMQQILGVDKWNRITDIKARSSSYYPLSPDRIERDHMECMYLGDLAELILSKHAWQHFQSYFRDKRQFQELIAVVSPVRNDRAHFAKVPHKELDRCRIACDDLLVMVERVNDRSIN